MFARENSAICATRISIVCDRKGTQIAPAQGCKATLGRRRSRADSLLQRLPSAARVGRRCAMPATTRSIAAHALPACQPVTPPPFSVFPSREGFPFADCSTARALLRRPGWAFTVVLVCHKARFAAVTGLLMGCGIIECVLRLAGQTNQTRRQERGGRNRQNNTVIMHAAGLHGINACK